jgi:hypothetical protein
VNLAIRLVYRGSGSAVGWKTENLVKGIPPGWVTPPERLVLMVMAGYVKDDELPRCYAGKKNIALACGWKSSSTLQRHWESLEDAKWLIPFEDQTQDKKTGKFTPRTWLMNLPSQEDWDSGDYVVNPTESAQKLSRRAQRTSKARDRTVRARTVTPRWKPPVTAQWEPPSPHSAGTKEIERNPETVADEDTASMCLLCDSNGFTARPDSEGVERMYRCDHQETMTA